MPAELENELAKIETVLDELEKVERALLAREKTRQAANPCAPNPCHNGGTCTPAADDDKGYICDCPPEYVGGKCQASKYYHLCGLYISMLYTYH